MRPRYYSSLAVQQNRQLCQGTVLSVVSRRTLNVEVVANFVNGSCLTAFLIIKGSQHIAFIRTQLFPRWLEPFHVLHRLSVMLLKDVYFLDAL